MVAAVEVSFSFIRFFNLGLETKTHPIVNFLKSGFEEPSTVDSRGWFFFLDSSFLLNASLKEWENLRILRFFRVPLKACLLSFECFLNHGKISLFFLLFLVFFGGQVPIGSMGPTVYLPTFGPNWCKRNVGKYTIPMDPPWGCVQPVCFF